MLSSMLMVFGGALLGTIGLFKFEIFRHHVHAIDAPQRRLWQLSRHSWGLVNGSLLALGTLSFIPAFGFQGTPRMFVILVALLIWWTMALVVPRIPLVKAQRQRKAIRLALPAAVNQWRISLEAGEKLLPMMQRYTQTLRPERLALQHVIMNAKAAVDAGHTHTRVNQQTGEQIIERMLFSDTLLAEAYKVGCPELTNVMSIIANADKAGGVRSAVPALKRASITLETIIYHELDEMLTKRALKLIAASAPAVVGAVLLLIFVAAAGSAVAF